MRFFLPDLYHVMYLAVYCSVYCVPFLLLSWWVNGSGYIGGQSRAAIASPSDEIQFQKILQRAQ